MSAGTLFETTAESEEDANDVEEGDSEGTPATPSAPHSPDQAVEAGGITLSPSETFAAMCTDDGDKSDGEHDSKNGRGECAVESNDDADGEDSMISDAEDESQSEAMMARSNSYSYSKNQGGEKRKSCVD